MIILDTNVVSEAMRPAPDAAVLTWLDQQGAETLYLTSVTLAELLFGIGALPGGQRKQRLSQMLDELLALFEQRILAFDAEAAWHYGQLAVAAKTAGKGLSTPDGYIAAIAASRGFAVATRDTAPFQSAGLQVVNPWKGA